MDNELYCPLCEDEYRDDNLPRLLINCGHSFCEKCLKKIMSEAKGCFKIVCPEDGEMVTLKDNSLSNIPKNIALMKIIESKKGNSSFKDLEMSKITRNEDFANEDDEAQDLVDAITSTCVDSEEKIPIDREQSTKIEIPEDEKSEKEKEPPQLCREHKKPLEVVCIFDMKKICVNCAIFGEHKGHEFKSLEEIEKERMDYYTSIIEIMDKKETINSRISNEETCSSIMELLCNKKNKMKTAMLEKYKKLMDEIDAKQKESLRSLDSLMQKTETKVKSLMKIDPNIMEKYDNWEYKSFEEIKILEGDNFEAKLKLLFNEPASGDVLEEGDEIVESMNKQEENMFNEVELSLENLGVEFNLEIFNHIEGFVEVLEEPKRKKSKARTTAITKVEVQSTKSFVSPVISQTSLGKSGFFSPIKDQMATQYPIEARSLTEEIRITPEKEKKELQVHEEDLLDVEFDCVVEKEPFFVKSEEFNIETASSKFGNHQSFIREDKNISSPPSKNFDKMKTTLERQKSPKSFEKAKKDDSFAEEKIERPNKKKLLKIKVPEKFEKIIEGLANDQLDAMDLTNAELGDATIVAISEFLNGSKVRSVKFIRNKLTDDSIVKILPYLRGVITLNLSQNLLTERVLDILLEGRPYLSSMRSIILSQNKIMERKAKAKLEKLKAMDLTISI